MNRIRELRENLSQKELADATGLTQRKISYYEKETRYIPTDALIALADFFNVSIDYLVGRTDVKDIAKKELDLEQIKDTPADSKPDPFDTVNELLFQYYNSLHRDAQKTIWQIIIMAAQMSESEKKKLNKSLIKIGIKI